MAWDEFCTLLSGLNEDTPLVRMAQIRKETDPKIIERWSDEQKRINREWQHELAMNMTKEQVLERLAPVSAMFENFSNVKNPNKK